ncbi:hypothetical protein [Streptomyces sp. NPDC050485]|uniref:hypothetical protein n=1 Tax=Streptomyces sp. NPDC050485 TaxID=3365617 RepID=UPI0037898DEB
MSACFTGYPGRRQCSGCGDDTANGIQEDEGWICARCLERRPDPEPPDDPYEDRRPGVDHSLWLTN